MHTKNRLCAALICFCATGPFFAAAHAGEERAFPINPASQPLLVVRADRAARLRDVRDTRPVRALGLADRDFSGRLPGVDIRVASLNAFLAALVRDEATAPWYCLAQDGGSIARQTGAMGWKSVAAHPVNPGEEAERRLAGMGLDLAKRAVTVAPGPDGTGEIVISRDAAARTEILGGGGRPNERWRPALAAFLSGGDGGVGLLINARPLLGVLGMTLGVDIRSTLARANLAVPDSLQLELFNNEGDLGLTLLCHSLLAARASLPASRPGVILEDGKDALLTLHFPHPEQMAALFRLDNAPLFLANLRTQSLVPHTATLSIRLDERGTPAWSLVGLMPDGEAFFGQYRRLREWLEALQQAPSSGVRLEKAVSASGEELVAVQYGGRTLVMGATGAPGGGAYWMAASTAADWPDPSAFTQRREERASLIAFDARLRREDRKIVRTALAAIARQNGLATPADERLESLLPDRDQGFVAIEERNLRLQSNHGLLPLLLPALAELFRR